jgi:hypothetical protein
LVSWAAAGPDGSLARRGGDDDNRSEFYGVVPARPEATPLGEWEIRGRSFLADAATDFDPSEGSLPVGSGAKGHVRSGRVPAIDRESLQNCP